MPIRHTFFFLFFLAAGSQFLMNCKSQKQIQAASLDSLASKQLGEKTEKHFNPGKTYVIYKEAPDTISFDRPVRYIIFRVKDNHHELEGTFTRGYIKWLDDRKVEIKSVPESAKDNKDLSPFIREVLIY